MASGSDNLELPDRPVAARALGTQPGESSAVQPVAVLPQAPKKRQPAAAKTTPRRGLSAGDRICGECGEGNPAIRKFCRRCGASLRDAEVVRESWWQRFRPKPKTLKAGGRPGMPGVKTGRRLPELSAMLRPIRWTVGVCALSCGIIYGVYSPFHQWVNTHVFEIKTRVETTVHPQYSEVRPIGVSGPAGDSIPGHPAKLIADGFFNTYWAAPSSVRDPSVVLRFSGTVNLDHIDITSGAYGDYSAFNRPEQFHLVYSNGQSDTVGVADQGTVQTRTLHHAQGITWIEIQVTEQWESVNGNQPVAVSEVEFFHKVT
jgi:ribosomal protein L40E